MTEKSKIRAVDAVPGVGVGIGTYAVGYFITSMASILGASAGTTSVMSLGTLAVAGAAGYGTALAVSKVRHAVRTTIGEAAQRLNIDPKIAEGLTSGPIGLIKLGADLAQRGELSTLSAPRSGTRMQSIIADAKARAAEPQMTEPVSSDAQVWTDRPSL